MRQFENDELAPEITAELAALDAALRGEAVDREHAELAELAVLVAAESPRIDPQFATELDGRAARRFAPSEGAAAAGSAGSGRGPRGRAPRGARRWWALSGVATAAVGALVAIIVVGSATRPVGPGAQRFATTSAAPATAPRGASARSSSVAPRSGGAASAGGAPAVLPPSTSGAHKVVQSAQLALATTPTRVEDVAGQVFEVVRLENGFVAQSNVTATGGSDGYAQFQLSVPSSSLGNAMARLSRLRGASVASRTDTTQDVNDEYGAATRRLADARALRSALLKQLGSAGDPQRVASLKGQIADADAAIGRAQTALGSLNRRINYTQVSLTVSADSKASAPGGFTLGRAAHDAVRVLTVAAGIALIALATLVPLALLGALLWWGASAIRRRRREQALDLA